MALAHGALFLVAFIYGISYVFAQIVLDGYLAPRALVALRLLTAWTLFALINAAFYRRWLPERADIPRFIAAGLTGTVINMTFFMEGLSRTSAIHASLIMTTTPVIILILSAVWLHSKIRPWQVVGVLMAGVGVVGLILAGRGLPGEGHWLGDLMILINAVSYGTYLILITPMMRKYPTPLVIFWVFSVGLAVMLPLGGPQLMQARPDTFTPMVWTSLAVITLGTTFLAYLLNAWALNIVPPYVVGVYVYMQPLIATLSAVFLGRDTLTLLKVFLGILIIMGVILTNMRRSPFHRPRAGA